MKRLALSVAAIAVLASLTSCSDDSASDDTGPEASEPTSEEPSEEATVQATEDAASDPARFATAYTQVATFFNELDRPQTDAGPTNAEEANAYAGLDDTTPLVFAHFSWTSVNRGGSFCLQSDTGTYIAVTDTRRVGEVALGDGVCSYDTAEAVVVGDVVSNTWTLGAEYMGGLAPTGILGVGMPVTK